MPKLLYVYEGIRAKEDRHELVGVRYFGGGYEGTAGIGEKTHAKAKFVLDRYHIHKYIIAATSGEELFVF